MNAGTASPTGNRVLISAGTGLGEAGTGCENRRRVPAVSLRRRTRRFAPINELQIDLLRYLFGRFEHVSYERVLSGPGLHNIYDFFTSRSAPRAGLVADEIKNGDPAAAIAKSAAAGSAAIAAELWIFSASIYGAEPETDFEGGGNGGCFYRGGIAPKIIAQLKGPAFMNAFTAKGAFIRCCRMFPSAYHER